MKFQLKNNSYLLMLMMSLAFVGDALSAERGADRPGAGASSELKITAGSSPIGYKHLFPFMLDWSQLRIRPQNPCWVVVNNRNGVTLHNLSVDHQAPGAQILLNNLSNDITFSPNGEEFAQIRTFIDRPNELLFKILSHDEGDDEVVKPADTIMEAPKASTISYSSDGKQLVILGDDKRARIVDLSTMEVVQTITLDTRESISNVLFALDDKMIVSISDSVYLHDTETRELVHQLKGSKSLIKHAVVCAGSRFIGQGSDYTIKSWDLATRRMDQELKSDEEVGDFASNGQHYLVLSKDNHSVQIKTIGGGIEQIITDSESKVTFNKAWFAPDRSAILTWNNQMEMQLWKVDLSGRQTKPAGERPKPA